jgi:intracellular multiplication protein IcmF
MRNILKNLFHAIKKIVDQFPENQQAISFLIATGLHQQGTTTLLKQTQMQHIHIDDEYPLQLFYNKNGIILELNETWVSQSAVSLSQLFKKLNRCHYKLRISGFLFFLDIEQFMVEGDEEQSKIIKTHALHFHQYIHALDYPVRSGLIITKLDQITGFTDFFQMSHDLELQEPLGFSLSFAKANSRFSTIFSDAWSSFVSHLNQVMMNKVHTTRANKKRILIREFPLQMALLETKFMNMIKNITHPRTQIHGIYFTCSEQKGKNINYLNQKIQKDFSLLVPVSSVQSVNFKHYFILGAIQSCQDLTSFTAKPKVLRDKSIQALLATGLLLTSYIVFQTVKTQHIIHTTKQQLEQSFAQGITDIHELDKTFSALDNLPMIFKYMNQIQILKNYLFTLEKNTYQTQFANELTKILENESQNTRIGESYNALKVYKAIQLKHKEQTKFILHWFDQYWAKHSDKKIREKNLKLLSKFIWEMNWPINQYLFQNTENILTSLSPDYLAFEIISQNLIQETETIEIPGFENEQIIVPKCYMKNYFQKTQDQLMLEFEQIQRDSWVLGKQVDISLRDRLIELYAQKYVNWWKNIATQYHPKHFNTFNDAKSVLNGLIQQKSIEKILKLISEQTLPNMQNPQDTFNRLVANSFTNFHFANQQTQDIHKILKSTEKFIGMFIVLNDNGQASFQYLRSYFNQTQFNDALYRLNEYANHSPEPTQIWLNQIQDDIWVLINQSTKRYLNEIWQANIYRLYETQLKNHYPFAQSSEEMSMENFEQFFGPNGLFQQYFRDYLQPFINTSQAQWVTKDVNNKKFPLSEQIIRKFIQANIITTMFFPNNAAHCNVHFSIEKMNLDPVVSQLTLNIGNQEIQDVQQEALYTQNIHWPEANAKLQINTIDGHHYQLEEKGVWGWYRLLDQINVLNDPNDASALQVLLEINGNSGRYLLRSSSSINPFIPSIFKDFYLDEKILN